MMLRTRLAVAALAWVAVVGCRNDIQAGIDSANELLYRKQYVDSDRLYRKLLKRIEDRGNLDDEEESQRLLILDRLGKINALYLHDYPQAIAHYQTLVRHYPKTDQAFAARATVADIYHHKLGDLQAAVDNYQKVVAEFPRKPESRRAQLQISMAYFELKNYEQARTEAETVINRWPDSEEAAQARFQIANSYYVEGRYAEAIATYERLLEDKPVGPLAPLVLFELGNCFQELGEPERALAYYYACLSDHPNPTLVQRKISRVRKRAQRSRPASTVELPPYLQRRLSEARNESRPAGRSESSGKERPQKPPAAIPVVEENPQQELPEESFERFEPVEPPRAAPTPAPKPPTIHPPAPSAPAP